MCVCVKVLEKVYFGCDDDDGDGELVGLIIVLWWLK